MRVDKSACGSKKRSRFGDRNNAKMALSVGSNYFQTKAKHHRIDPNLKKTLSSTAKRSKDRQQKATRHCIQPQFTAFGRRVPQTAASNRKALPLTANDRNWPQITASKLK